MLRVSSAHEEGGERVFSVNTDSFSGVDGRVSALNAYEVELRDGRFEKVDGTEYSLDADLVLLAMGFVGPDKPGLLTDLGVELDARGNVARSANFETSVPGVFAAGDMGRGQSLIVWAIAEGRAAAAGVDAFLQGESALPAPIRPTTMALR
jgi:glutamate synthase (NADPH/NADH) small chain